MTIQTACSSSLVGLHEACQALQSGECSTALVGGTSLIWGPTMTDAMTKNMVLSPSGISHTFDADADGYGRGEGINCVYLKPLRDALRDSDPIRAVIRSTVTNHDGKTPNFSQPCPISQEKLIRQAYQVAGIDAIHDTPVFECHGTGTAVGDVIEASVVAKMTGGEQTYITAVSVILYSLV
jgi:acyl transferase domain-containing protein